MQVAGIHNNPKLGYYRVGQEIFYSKPAAFIRATETKQIPEWRFNTVGFARVDWTVEPATNLRELYRQRAQQLRDRYDYIRIECSGGGDSTTAVFAFLLNDIHLDEIVFRYPKKGENGVTNDAFNTNANNTLSEFQFAAQPLLNWVKTKFPKTVVRIHDFSENMLNEESTRDESWVFQTQHWFQPAHHDKYNQFAVAEHRALADSGRSICVLLGIDKPRLALINGDWYTYFTDVQGSAAHPVVGDYTNITNEYFYWTPDFPEIVMKQSHMIKTWFELPQNQHLLHLVKLLSVGNVVAHRTTYEHIAKSIIYPDYDLATWQTNKPTNSFYNEMDTWFYKNFRETRLYSAWEAGLAYLVNKIDPALLAYELGQAVGLKHQNSHFYHLGAAKSVPITAKFDNSQQFNTQEITVLKDRKIQRMFV